MLHTTLVLIALSHIPRNKAHDTPSSLPHRFHSHSHLSFFPLLIFLKKHQYLTKLRILSQSLQSNREISMRTISFSAATCRLLHSFTSFFISPTCIFLRVLVTLSTLRSPSSTLFVCILPIISCLKGVS